MSVQEIVEEIPKLSYEERQTLLRVITLSLQEKTKESFESDRRGVSAEKLRGIIKFPDGHIPDDDEIDEIRFQALSEKYLQ